ncbi:hypothetical protein [Actinoplanes sp. N902-109]|uniref:hypothetical protein n=1 Tax=Actinoplanes sp. (strain N902-109) TaxID=649831 RepID=UPI00032966EB|nr:hypothetical protein [Actinoplanes sp. N902-109]AGL13831.1 hypothetical protein L083_0321 [Actinoplanes sp. N902-109]
MGRHRFRSSRACRGGCGGCAAVAPRQHEHAHGRGAGRRPSKAKAPFTYPTGDFSGTFGKFKAGDLTVTGTSQVTTAYQVATITAPGKGQQYEGNDGKTYFAPHVVGHVITYAKGAFKPAGTGFHAGEKQKPIKPGFPAGYSDSTYTWEYADGAWGQVVVDGGKYTEKDLAAVAKGLTGTDETPIKVGFKLGQLPDGYRLVSAGQSTNYLEPTFEGQSYVQVVKGDVPTTGLTGTFGDSYDNGSKQLPNLQFQVFPAWQQKYMHAGNEPYCGSEGICYAYTKDKKFFIEAIGGGFVPDSELLTILKSVEFADPTDTATWFPAEKAIG